MNGIVVVCYSPLLVENETVTVSLRGWDFCPDLHPGCLPCICILAEALFFFFEFVIRWHLNAYDVNFVFSSRTASILACPHGNDQYAVTNRMIPILNSCALTM